MASRNEKLLTRIRAISQHLRDTNAPGELVDTADSLLAPNGWAQLRMATEADSPTPNSTVSIGRDLLTEYQEASAKAGSNLTVDVVKGVRAFVKGSFTPANLPTRGQSRGVAATMSVRVPADLKAEFKAAAAARAEELGYTAAFSHVAKEWLAHLYAQPAK